MSSKKSEALGNMSAAERLRIMMKEMNFRAVNAAAKALSINVSTLQSVLSRDAISRKTAEVIAEKWGYEADWVERGWGPMRKEDVKAGPSPSVDLSCTIIDPWSAGEHLVGEFDHQGKDEKSSVRVRLHAVMEAFNLDTGIALAHAAGLSSDLLGEILSKDEIDPDTAYFVAKRLGIEREWLLKGEGPMQKPGSEIEGYRGESSDQAAKRLTSQSPRPGDKGRVRAAGPAFSMVPKAATKVSAGGGIIPEEGTTGEEYAFRVDWLKTVATSTRQVILVDVDGDSMTPTLLDKDTVLIDLGRTELRDGRIYAIAVGDVVNIKRLQRLPGDRIRVISDNPAYYTYEAKPDELRIIGQAIWYGRTMV